MDYGYYTHGSFILYSYSNDQLLYHTIHALAPDLHSTTRREYLQKERQRHSSYSNDNQDMEPSR